MLNFFKSKGTPEENFWQWVTKNIQKIKAIRGGGDPVFRKANDVLEKYHEGLFFEVSGDEIIITADGNKDLFGAVIKLCDAAPSTNEYQVVAFRQASEFPDLQYGDFDIASKDVFFGHQQGDGFVDLVIYHKDYCKQNHDMVAGAIFIMLDHGIGEYDVEERLRYIDFGTYTDLPDLRPLCELKAIVDKMNQDTKPLKIEITDTSRQSPVD